MQEQIHLTTVLQLRKERNKMNTNSSGAKRLTLGITLMIILATLLSACLPAETPTPVSPTPTAEVKPASVETEPVDLSAQLVGPLWLLLGYGDALNPTVVEPGVTVTAQFAEDNSLSGSGGCNNYFGPYELNGEEIKIGPLGSTMMACEHGMTQEAIVLEALQKAYKLAFTPQGRLEIFYDSASSFEKKLVFSLSQKSLVDTLWVLEAFGKPEQLSALETGTIITAQFSEDGILSGAAGCNQYTSSYEAQDGRLEVGVIANTMRACTQGMEQEAAYLQALAEAESYTINGTTLEITFGGGQGILRYTSRNLPIENVLWTLVAMNGSVEIAGQSPTTALFEPGAEPGKGAVGGVAMCNNYSGEYSLEGSALTIEGFATTLASCPDTVMQTQEEYLEVLGAAQSYEVVGETLLITSEKGLLTFSANRTPLEATYWRLNSMGTIESPTIPSQGAEFIAQFFPQEGGPSGLIIGSTGCNDYNATYVANLSEIKVNLPHKTNNPGCAPSFWEQEQQFFLGLNDASTYRIVGNTLQIPYDEGRQALNFTAFVPEPPPPSTGGPLTPLNGTRWWLVMIGPRAVLPGSQVTAEFAINADGETGTLSGNAGCNTYNAPIEGALQLGPIASTKRTCSEPPGVMNQEYEYLAALQTANSFTLASNQLLIGTNDLLLVFYNSPAPLLPIVPPTPLPPLPPRPTEIPPTAEPTAEPTFMPPSEPTVEPIPTEKPTEEPTATPLPAPPVAVITAPDEGTVDQGIVFDAGSSTSGGSITEFVWDFGDGVKVTGVKVEHKYSKPGTYIVTLTIKDSNGKVATVTHSITIK
jgi:heat shock protein HslJ